MKLKPNIIIFYSESSLFKKYETEDKTSGCIVSKNILNFEIYFKFTHLLSHSILLLYVYFELLRVVNYFLKHQEGLPSSLRPRQIQSEAACKKTD